MPPQKSITNAQKAALCAQQQLQPDLSNLEIHAWFQQAYNQSISPSSISKILCQLDEQILAQFQPVPEEDSNSNEEEEVLPHISYLDAFDALQTVHLYEEQQQEGLQEVIQALNHLENEIEEQKLYMWRQQAILLYNLLPLPITNTWLIAN